MKKVVYLLLFSCATLTVAMQPIKQFTIRGKTLNGISFTLHNDLIISTNEKVDLYDLKKNTKKKIFDLNTEEGYGFSINAFGCDAQDTIAIDTMARIELKNIYHKKQSYFISSLGKKTQKLLLYNPHQLIFIASSFNQKINLGLYDYMGNLSKQLDLTDEFNIYGEKKSFDFAYNTATKTIYFADQRELKEYIPASNTIKLVVKSPNSLFQKVAISEDGSYLVAATTNLIKKDPKIKIWNLQQGKALFAIPISDRITSLGLLKNNFIVCGFENGTVEFWELKTPTPKPHKSFWANLKDAPIKALAFSNDETLMATGYELDGNIFISIWDIKDKPLEKAFSLQKKGAYTDIIIENK
jgi:WD40 repeat protein